MTCAASSPAFPSGACSASVVRPGDFLDDRSRRPRRDGEEGRAGNWFKSLKLKLGGRDGRDVERVEAVREAWNGRLRVDVNEYWTIDEALDALPRLAELGVDYCEQPLPAGDPTAPS